MTQTDKEISSQLWSLIQTKTFMLPMWWEYEYEQGYGNISYDLMCYDTNRMNAYQKAIQSAVRNKKVAEIGSGSTLPLTLMCAEAGAEFVYAIEGNPDACKEAINLVHERGLEKKIEIIPKDSSDVVLPEKVDICLSEIIGPIGSSEGAVSILYDARRFIKDDGIMIPDRCVTMIAPVYLPDNLYRDDFIDKLIQKYQKSAFRHKEDSFSINRFGIYNFPESHLLAEPQIFEDIRFNGELSPDPEFTNRISFNIISENNFDGFLLWINLYPDSQTMIDSFKRSCWGTVFIPHEHGIVSLKKGDVMEVIGSARLSQNRINPNYAFNGTVFRDNKEIYSISADAPFLNYS